MELSLDKVKPCVRFASEVMNNKDYPNFLYAYDYRLFYILSGAMQFEFCDKTIDMNDGYLLIFPPEVAYKIKFKNKKTCKYIVLNFDFDYIASDATATPPQPANTFKKSDVISRSYYPPFKEIFFLKKTFNIENDLAQIIANLENLDTYSKEDASAIMKHLLVKIIRATQQNQKNTSETLCDEIKEYIKLNFAEDITNISIAEHFGYHPYYLNSVFVKHSGMTLHNYILNVRLNNARTSLLCTDYSIREISEQCGFFGQSYFSECFKSQFGKSPTEYRSQRW